MRLIKDEKSSRKPKVAISLDKPLLELVDSKVDGNVLRSRSQAIEFFLRKGLYDQSIDTAVILLRGKHQNISLKKIKGKSLIKKQLEFFDKNNINNVFIITQHTKEMNVFLNEVADSKLNIKVVEKEVDGNAKALYSLKDELKGDFIVMSGDTFNDFELNKLIKKHLETAKLGTMGLMTRSDTKRYGTAILEGDSIIEFQEKPKESSTNIVNAGVYAFKREVFELFDNVDSLEKDLFSKLAKIKQLTGFFTYGEYLHIDDRS